MAAVRLSGKDDFWQIDHMKIDNVWMQGDPAVIFPPSFHGTSGFKQGLPLLL